MDNLEIGDIIIKDSSKTGAKIVKFLMTAPTIWHHIIRAIKGTQEIVEYYHPAMVINQTQVIEQQWKVQKSSLNNMLGGESRRLIVRKINVTEDQMNKLAEMAENDLGQGYGVIQTFFGKFPTWLTGIPFFARYVKLPNNEICVTRVARWYYEAFGETFGCKKYTEVTTHILATYTLTHPEKYVILDSRG